MTVALRAEEKTLEEQASTTTSGFALKHPKVNEENANTKASGE